MNCRQEAFSIQDCKHAGMMTNLVNCDDFSSSGILQKSREDGSKIEQANESHITSEILAFFAEWTANHKIEQNNMVKQVEIMDPSRCAKGDLPAPKRFYRTFWRSLVRKALRDECEAVVTTDNL
jgi:hypothetical protein